MKLRGSFCVVLLAVALFSGSAFAAGDVVFIDLQEVFKRFYKTQLAQDQLRQQSADMRLELEAMQDEIKGLKEEIEVLRADSRDETLSEEVREGKLNLLEEKLVELRRKQQDAADFERSRMQQMDQQNKRMTRKIFDEIQGAVDSYARAKGCDAVIDRSAQSRAGTPVVLFAAPTKDITSDVLAVLNEGRTETGEAK